MLGLKPALGRFFRPDEDTVPDRDRVAILSYEFWRTRFASSPDALRATLLDYRELMHTNEPVHTWDAVG